ncbi:MAG: flagellar export chaperone FlgN, partial [Phycisphaerae bacterium]|nr:flagellar export chaperone FlgN [Phycisphaerae bacterium]
MTTNENPDATLPHGDAMLDLLVRQHELYRELRRLARTQRDLIAAEDPSALLNLLSQRQKLIAQLADINIRLEPV